MKNNQKCSQHNGYNILALGFGVVKLLLLARNGCNVCVCVYVVLFPR